MIGDSSSLTEPGNHDPLTRDTRTQFSLDQFPNGGGRRLYLLQVNLALYRHGEYVVPRRHHHTAIDCDGDFRGVGENKPHTVTVWQSQMGHHRDEIVTAGA
jgi:hypothetical protein